MARHFRNLLSLIYFLYPLSKPKLYLEIYIQTPSMPSRCNTSLAYNLCTMHEKSLALDLVEGLFARLLHNAANDHLCAEGPRRWHAPCSLDLGVDNGVVVLQVGAYALGCESGPDGVLVHGSGLSRPSREVICERGKFRLHGFDDGAVVEEEDLWLRQYRV